MALITMQNVKKSYQLGKVTVPALRGVDLEIEEGAFAAVVGPSGSGKTTIMNLVGGLDTPTEGQVSVDSVDLSRLSSKKLSDLRLKSIGFIFQAYNLIPVLSARENVEFVLLLQGVGKKERRDRADQALADVSLDDLGDRRPSEMSGGQQQRVAVARAISGQPSLVLADEPTANLDTKTGNDLLELMKDLNERRGVTFLFSTHDPKVMEYARRIITLVDGQVSSDERKNGDERDEQGEE